MSGPPPPRFWGTHPAVYAEAINALELEPTMRNMQYPGSDDDEYANPQDLQTCAVPLAHNAFQWTRGDNIFKLGDGKNSREFKGDPLKVGAPHYSYAQALSQAQGIPLFKKDGVTPYTAVAFPDYKYDTTYKTDKPTCAVGVTLAPWGVAQAQTPGDGGGTRFGYDGACYQPPHCGC